MDIPLAKSRQAGMRILRDIILPLRCEWDRHSHNSGLVGGGQGYSGDWTGLEFGERLVNLVLTAFVDLPDEGRGVTIPLALSEMKSETPSSA